ncbi:LOW QUALITY PROTEIN: steroid 17-alpha-hydroxylase/17,20 lyase isoform X1 [Hydra vulgaris]|uniref:LOW QUALITY PROTEIN: steroid 17-alpha-hydroxylase/17,20 lyase isoform X1 n=1 Tax=Hydra vulgaris TaxID=6087 RepID=UPI0032EA34C6
MFYMLFKVIGTILIPPLIWVVWIYIKHLVDCLSYPQGPFPLPFMGNVHLIRNRESYKVFSEFQKFYGSVFGFSIGSTRYVVVNNLEGVQEVLIKKGSQFAGRPRRATWSRALNGLVACDPGPRFKVLRKLASSSLKIYAEGLVGMEKKAADEYSHLNKKLQTMNGKPVSLQNMIELGTLNIICTILFNHRYEEDDKEFQDIIKYSNLTVKIFGGTSILSSIPWLRFLPSASSRSIYEIVRIRDPLLKKKLQEHKSSFDENNLRDVTDALIKVSLDSDIAKGSEEKISDENIEFLLNDFIIAGSETSSSKINFITKLKVTSGKRYPCLNDRPLLHLMQATIHETLRLSSVGPLAIVHKAMENSSICGKPVPKGAFILTNLWSIHHDESYWKNPMCFYPERWLEKSGEFNSKLGYAFLPFSGGPRSCLGEALARTELFVFFSRLVTDYRFEKPNGEELPRLNGRFGLTCSPFDLKSVVVPRC